MRRLLVVLTVAGLGIFAMLRVARADSRDITRQPDGILDASQDAEWTGLGVGNFDGNVADDLVFERTLVNGGGRAGTAGRQFDVLFGPFEARAKGSTQSSRYRPDPGMSITMVTDQKSPLTVADLNHDGRDDLVFTHVESSSSVEWIRLAVVFGRDKAQFPKVLNLDKGGRADAVLEYSRQRRYDESSRGSSDITVKFGDVNGDGNVDTIIGTDPSASQSGTLSVADRSEIVVLLGNGTWQAGTKLSFGRPTADYVINGLGPCYSSLVGVADVTGDGLADIVSKSCKAVDGVAKQVQVIAGSKDWHHADGVSRDLWVTNDAAWRVRTDWTAGSVNLPNYFVRDINSDGIADVAFSLDGTTHVWYGGADLPRHQSISRSNRVFLNASFGTLSYTRAWRPADLDGDGRNDLLLTQFDPAARDSSFGSLNGQPIRVYHDGEGAEVLDVSKAPAEAIWNDTSQVLWGMGDFNGDGQADILLGCRSVQDFFYPFVYGPLVK